MSLPQDAHRHDVLWRVFSQFLGFASVSGLCWLLDFTILMVLTVWFGLGPLMGNIISSTIAAAVAFTITTLWVFNRNEGMLHRKLALYLTYNLCMILLASWAMKGLVGWLVDMLSHQQAIIVAKIAVTPVQMLCNFMISKMTSERLRV